MATIYDIFEIYASLDERLKPVEILKKLKKSGNEYNNIFRMIKILEKKGLIRKDIKIDFILYYLNQMLQMFDDKQLVSKYDHPHDLIMEAMNFLFYGLLSQK